LNRRATTIGGLYAIADRDFNPFDSLAMLARKYLEGGAKIVQLRMKDSGPGTRDSGLGTRIFRDNALEIMKLKGEFDFTFIVNDYVDVALDVEADGVHVGENDEAVASIRKRAGDDLIIGYSSHSVGEARGAEMDGADYVAFGAIFPTRTKGPGHPVQGLGRLKEIASSVRVPVVAIGGITRENVADVVAVGVDSIAMITAISQARDVVAETAWFVRAIADGNVGV
jgi:thiamine-phosphate pyrophosphorylase